MAAFSAEDVFIKSLSATFPIGQILILFGLGGAVVFACAAFHRKERLFSRDVMSRPMWLRIFFEVIGRLFFVLAIALTPLSSTTVILQATPIVVVAGAALVFGERVSGLKWIAILVGLAGVVVIVRPGADSFSPMSILAVLGTLGFAGRDLASRAAPRGLTTSVLGFYGFVAITLAGALYSMWSPALLAWPSITGLAYLTGAITMGTLAYAALMKAMRTGEVSTVTPFRYSRLIFGFAFGFLLFGEQFSVQMLIGTCLIFSSGLLLFTKKRLSFS